MTTETAAEEGALDFGLTDAERAAINEYDDEAELRDLGLLPEKAEAGAEDPEDGSKQGVTEEPEKAGKEAVEGEAEAAEVEGEVEADSSKADKAEKVKPESPEPEPLGDFLPRLKSGEIDLGEVRAKIAELDEQYELGDISLKDYTARRDELRDAIQEAVMFEKINRQTQEQRWQWEQETFFRDNPGLRPDANERTGEDADHYGYFEYQAQKLLADPRLDGLSALRQAKAQADRLFGRGAKKEQEKPEPPDLAEVKEQSRQAKAKREIAADVSSRAGKNLGDAPASQAPDTGQHKFQHLEKLMETDPEAFQKELGQLSEAEREEFARIE